MSEKRNEQRVHEDGEVVYRRISPGVDESPQSGRIKRQRVSLTKHLAPTLKTAIVGFALLLALVLLLGYLSVRKLDEVGRKILDDQRRHTAIRDFTLELRIDSTKLDNEARARGRKLTPESEETRPLFDTPLNRERNKVKDDLKKLEKPPYSEN